MRLTYSEGRNEETSWNLDAKSEYSDDGLENESNSEHPHCSRDARTCGIIAHDGSLSITQVNFVVAKELRGINKSAIYFECNEHRTVLIFE